MITYSLDLKLCKTYVYHNLWMNIHLSSLSYPLRSLKGKALPPPPPKNWMYILLSQNPNEL